MRQIVVSAETSQLPTVIRFMEATLATSSCTEKKRKQLILAAEEAFVNIAHYAYGGEGGTVGITLTIAKNPPLATLTFTDTGVAHNPLETPPPDLTLPAEQRKIGGLGIYLISQSVDTVSYRYENGQNILTLVKAL